MTSERDKKTRFIIDRPSGAGSIAAGATNAGAPTGDEDDGASADSSDRGSDGPGSDDDDADASAVEADACCAGAFAEFCALLADGVGAERARAARRASSACRPTSTRT